MDVPSYFTTRLQNPASQSDLAGRGFIASGRTHFNSAKPVMRRLPQSYSGILNANGFAEMRCVFGHDGTPPPPQ
jgi:hypothetical protein